MTTPTITAPARVAAGSTSNHTVRSPSGGRPPFGYRIADPGCLNRARSLEPDPAAAPVVRRIFDEYLAGHGLQAIATKLTAERVTRPSVRDRLRNPHHTGSAWSKGAVRAILTNSRYLGAADHHELAGGYPPLVTAEDYERVLGRLAERGAAARSNHPAQDRGHVLRGLLRCALCHRLMQGTWNNDAAYYRCRVHREAADANGLTHPPNVYLRESRVLPPLQNWFAEAVAAPVVRAWMFRQIQAPVRRAAGRLDTLYSLARGGPMPGERCAELYRDLDTRVLYLPEQRSIQIKASLLPGSAVHGTVSL